jgi:hypothetical protein
MKTVNLLNRPTLFIILTCVAVSLFSCSGESTKSKPGSVPVVEKPIVAAPHAAFDTLKDGDFTMRYANGVIQMKGFYRNGKREGEWVCFFPSGKTQSEGFFTAGKRDHHAKVFYENGHLMYEGDYTDGVMTGKWKYYNADGTFNQEVDYSKLH